MSLLRLAAAQARIMKCRACPAMVGGPVHGATILSRILLIGQAPGTHEESRGRPFAHTAGKTLFRWFDEAAGVSEAHFREHVYMAAVARCFPGKSPNGGDRLPNAREIENCRRHLAEEVAILSPELVLPVGKLAISEVLGSRNFPATAKLVDFIGRKLTADYLGRKVDVICLPHPSGLSAWHKSEPGISLTRRALGLIVNHPAWREEME